MKPEITEYISKLVSALNDTLDVAKSQISDPYPEGRVIALAMIDKAKILLDGIEKANKTSQETKV